jgi:uncharacterized Zn finger protein
MTADRIRSAVKALAECSHLEDHHQYVRAALTDSVMVRCSECGAVAMADDLTNWTRPVLVAHVVGAAR